jgi:hypothetical protein
MALNELKKLRKTSREEIDGLKTLLDNKALTQGQRRSLAARILGVHRRYKQALIIEITAWALQTDGSPASKHKIEKWQQSTFGHSISNDALAVWCKSDRGCGDRIELDISDETTATAKELWALYADGLKVSEITLNHILKAKVLDAAIGL